MLPTSTPLAGPSLVRQRECSDRIQDQLPPPRRSPFLSLDRSPHPHRSQVVELDARRRVADPNHIALPGKYQSGRLRDEVEKNLDLDWSPEQISIRLPLDFPTDHVMRISHETIYLELFLPSRKALHAR